MSEKMNVFRVPIKGGEVFACWPNQGDGLGAALSILALNAEHWSAWHRQQERQAAFSAAAADVEYASWFRAASKPPVQKTGGANV